MNDFELSTGEKLHPLWMRLKAHLQERLDAARQRNDQSLLEAETALNRGEIRCLKRLIALGDDRPVTGDAGAP